MLLQEYVKVGFLTTTLCCEVVVLRLKTPCLNVSSNFSWNDLPLTVDDNSEGPCSKELHCKFYLD